MRLLVDTNIFLEIILEQERASQARELLEKAQEHELFLSDYSLHSIGLLLFRRNQYDIFQKFIDDMLNRAGIALVSLGTDDMSTVISSAQQFRLDFDDSYQYAAARKYDLAIVSYDADFDRTEYGRRTPSEITSQR